MTERSPQIGLVGAAALLVGLGGILLWLNMLAGAWRLGSGIVEVGDHLRRAEKGLTQGRTKTARFETLGGVAAVERAQRGFDSGGPLLDLARLAPQIDGVMTEAPHLLAAADYSASAALGTLNIAENALTGPNKIVVREGPDDPESSARVRLDRIEEIGALITDIRGDLENAKRELESVRLGNLPRRARDDVTDGIATASDTDKLLAKAELAFELLPAILGGEETRTYLLAMQNSAELRGTGGAMLRFIDLQFSEGRAELLKSQSVYNIDKDRQQLTIPLPEDAWYVREIADSQRFGNANWSPDWPLTSRLTLAYRAEADRLLLTDEELPEIHGVIGVDPVVMQQLLKGAGRFETGGGRPITSEKVLGVLLYKAYAQFGNNPGERRSFLRDVVDRFYARVLRPERPLELVRGMGQSLVWKNMQIWMADPAEQAFVKRMGWDGAIQPARGADYFYVVEQNVGGNKLNYFELQEHRLDIAIDGTDSVTTAEVRVRNNTSLPLPRYVGGDTMGKHRPMINVYVPDSAQLIEAAVPEGELLPGAAEGTSDWPAPNIPAEHFELGKKVWSATLEILPMEEGAVRYTYRVPDAVRIEGGRHVYRLVLQRQPKVRPETITVRLELPSGATEIKARGFDRDGNQLTLKRVLKEDAVLEVTWQE